MSEKRHYVAVIDLDDRSVLVVGAGRVAHEKARGLLDCGAAVTIVAPRISPEVAALQVELLHRPYRRSDLDGRYLVVAATGDPAVNTRVFADAEARALLCNVVDVPQLCSFILPALHREDPITVAVSTGGASPVLAQRLRDEVAKVVRPEHAALAVRLRELRPWAKAHLPTYEARRDYFAGLVREERMTVYLVGAGPGDPALITARGLALIASCDVLVHDRLVAPELVAEASPDALVISREGLSQPKVTELLVEHGLAGSKVVRLKGGDPFIFGRGGEEALALKAAGIAVEVVPGVSSLASVPAAAGIPVTHRGISDRVTIASCHGADDGDPDYASLAAAGGTLLLFMGRDRVERVVAGLVAAGLSPETPAAAISRGTLPDQEVRRTTLAGLASAAAGLAGPALLVVGDVAALELLADASAGVPERSRDPGDRAQERASGAFVAGAMRLQ